MEVRITPRSGILDPEGATIERALRDLGYAGVARVHAGRLIRFELEAANEKDARATATRMCEELIANPVIEDYAIAIEPASREAEIA